MQRSVNGPERGASAALLAAMLVGCGVTVESPPAYSEAILVDHHLHIRTAESARLLDRINQVLDDESAGPGTLNRPVTAQDVLVALDSAGIERGVILSSAYMFAMPDLEVVDELAQVRAENDYVAEQTALHPDRLVGFCSVNPLRDYALTEIERCGADSRLVGVKLHLANSDVDLRNPDHVASLERVFELLEALDLGAVVHVRTRNPDYGARDAETFIDEVLGPHPDVAVQIAHVAGWGGYDEATDAALGAFARAFQGGRLDPSRVTFDLGAVVFQPEAAGADTALINRIRGANQTLASRIREIGVDRFVYATDWPSWPPVADARLGIAANLRLIRAALPLSDEEMARLLRDGSEAAGSR